MSTAAAETHLVEPAESPLTPESWGKLGMWNFLAGDLNQKVYVKQLSTAAGRPQGGRPELTAATRLDDRRI